MFSLAKIEIAQFLKPYVKDAIEFPDIETLSALLEIKRTDAEKIVVKNKEELAGYKVRDVICTKEARELKREILKILASYTMTKNGKEFALTLTPILEIEELQKRFEDVRETGRLIAILGNEKIDRVRKIISEAAIEEKTRSYSYRRSPPPIIATRQTGLELEAEINEQYGDFVHVAIVETAGKAEELSQKGTTILLLSGEGEGEDAAVGGVFDEPGIITITRDDLSDVCVVYPEFVVNSFAVKKKAILAVIRLLTEFKELKDSFLFNSPTAAVEDLEAVVTLIDEIAAVRSAGTGTGTGTGTGIGETNFDEVIYRWEASLNKEANRIMRSRSGGGAEEFKAYLDEVVVNVTDELMLTSEDKELLRESAYENLERGPPFEFSRAKTELLRERYERKMREREYYRLRDCAKQLEQKREAVSIAIKQLFYFDLMLAVSQFSHDFELTIPEIIEGGLSVINGRNIFLVDEELRGGGGEYTHVVPVSYSVGETNSGIFGATSHPVSILTGANSGGKTSLMIMLATSIILTGLGLPVPAERAEMPLLPLYVYRRKMVKKTGSFEYSIRALSRIFMREGAKLVLIDELEALTEPGAMGRIMASVINNLPDDTRAVIITHLIHELLPHISLKKVRVDGIESKGLDAAGNIIVDRQPIFNHVGSSTPELVITKLLGRVRKKELRTVYEEILTVLEKEREGWN